MRPGGVVVHIGHGGGSGEADFRRMTLQEITFIGTYTFTKQDFRETARTICDGRLGALDWTEKRPLAAGQSALKDILAGRAEVPTIVLKPQARPETGGASVLIMTFKVVRSAGQQLVILRFNP